MLLNEFLAQRELIYFLLSILLFLSLIAFKLLSKVKQRFFFITVFNLLLVAGTYTVLSLSSIGPINTTHKEEMATLIDAYHKNSQKIDSLMPLAADKVNALELAMSSKESISYKTLEDLGYMNFRNEFFRVYYQNIIVKSKKSLV